MSEAKLLYLSQADVSEVGLTMREIIDALETAFKEKGAGRVEMPPKPGIHPQPDAFIHAMPAYIPALKSAGLKWVSGFPKNVDRGLPYITGLLVLNDPETGLPLSVMDCVWITGMRTGAATALAAKYLARPDAATVGILGCGVQGRTNLLALKELFPLTSAHAYDIHPERTEAYATEMHEKTGLDVQPVTQPREAVAGCDIVVTAGPILKQPHATIQAGWLEPGAFASPVDFDSYWHPDALAQADKFCTDDTPQLRYYQEVGYFQRIPPVHADLGELAAGKRPGRERDDERIICCNLGLAIDDMATAILIYQRAVERGIGTWLPL
jgi:ornithine cyclodeaminase/alanine dehydrogenase-like protein (mu-crystallin family)